MITWLIYVDYMGLVVKRASAVQERPFNSLTHSLQHWNRNVVILTQFLSLAELEMTTSSAGTDENLDQNYVISIPMSADKNHKRRNTNNRAPGICDVTARAIYLYSFLLYRGHFSLESFPWKQPTVGQ